MLRLLLDTHVVLWALGDPGRLSKAARHALVNPDNELAVSAVTAWEVAIKRQLGKLTTPGTAKDWLVPAVEELGARWTPIGTGVAASVETLPQHHRDPFDRVLIAQAILEGWTLVSADPVFDAYGVTRLAA